MLFCLLSVHVSLLVEVKDDPISAAKPAGAFCPTRPDTLLTPVGEIAARETPQSALLWYRTFHQALRGTL